MNDMIVWIIIIAFYAPLHFMLPILFLFITGRESETVRKSLIQRALTDATISLLLAFTVAILLVKMDLMIWAMLVLLLSMMAPFVRIFQHRREIT